MIKRTAIALATATMIATACNPVQEKAADVNLDNKHEEFSYCLGMDIAYNISAGNFDSLEIDAFLKGITDVMDSSETGYTREESQQIVQTYLQQQRVNQMKGKQQEGQAFLEKNAQREEVTVLESGLQYEVLKQGDGPKPGLTDKVKTHYSGTLLDGTEFDSSYKRGEPATFPVNGVIAGWTEALQLMPVGSKWKLYIPSNLAYGERGAGGRIGPNETLIFEIELLEIVE